LSTDVNPKQLGGVQKQEAEEGKTQEEKIEEKTLPPVHQLNKLHCISLDNHRTI